jgi:hypothetical protein
MEGLHDLHVERTLGIIPRKRLQSTLENLEPYSKDSFEFSLEVEDGWTDRQMDGWMDG